MMNAWYGWSFIVAAVILALNFVIMLKMGFPAMNRVGNSDKNDASEAPVEAPNPNGTLKVFAFVLYGYISQATFYLISQWLYKVRCCRGSNAGLGSSFLNELLLHRFFGLRLLHRLHYEKKAFAPLHFLLYTP